MNLSIPKFNRFVFGAAGLLILGACQKESASTVVCWEEPVQHVSAPVVFADKFSPEMRVVCAPISARPVNKQVIYRGPSSSAPVSSGPQPAQPPAQQPPAQHPPQQPPAEKKDGVARVDDLGVAALDPDTGFAIVRGDTVIAGSEQGNTDLNKIMDNLFGESN